MIDPSKYSDEELLNAVKTYKASKTQQTAPKYGGVAGLLAKINPAFGNLVGDAARGYAAGAGIKTPDEELGLDKLYAQEAIKKQFDDPIDRQLKEARIKNLNNQGLYDPALDDETPEGFIRVNGKLARDPSYRRQPTPAERSRVLEDEAAKSEITNMAKALPKLDQADQAASQLQDLYKTAVPNPVSVKEGDVMGGLKARMAGFGQTATAAVGANPNLNRYRNERQAFSGNIAKGGFGESGMLTQKDIERISAILPSEYSTKEESDIAWREIRNILGSARQRFNMTKSNYINHGVSDIPEEAQSGVPGVRDLSGVPDDFSGMSDEELRRIASGG